MELFGVVVGCYLILMSCFTACHREKPRPTRIQYISAFTQSLHVKEVPWEAMKRFRSGFNLQVMTSTLEVWLFVCLQCLDFFGYATWHMFENTLSFQYVWSQGVITEGLELAVSLGKFSQRQIIFSSGWGNNISWIWLFHGIWPNPFLWYGNA